MAKKRGLLVLLALVLTILCLTTCAGLTGGGSVKETRVSAYIRTWPIPEAMRDGDNPYWTADMIPAEHLTDLIIAFALLDPADRTTIYIPETRPLADGSPSFQIWDEVAKLKEKHPHLRVNFSVGGGSAVGLAGLSEMAANREMRAAFIENVCRWLEDYNLDGVDIDWEYPVGAPWDDVRYPQDRKNYITLLKELRSGLDKTGEKTGKRYGLFTAVPASPWFVQANDVRAVAKIVDYLKLMCYDYYGPWYKMAGHNANLYINPIDPMWGGWSTSQGLQVYFDDWIPMEKIMLGVAFYGRACSGVPSGPDPATPGLFQPWTSLPHDGPFYEGSIAWSDIKELLEPGSGYTRYWDDAAKAPWLYNGDVFLSYTDQELIKLLAEFAKNKKLGGAFVWEAGHDLDGELFKVLAENMR